MKKYRLQLFVLLPIVTFVFLSINIRTLFASSGLILPDNSHFITNDFINGEIIVKYKKDKINLDKIADRISVSNNGLLKSLKIKKHLKKDNISIFKATDNATLQSHIDELKNDPSIEYVEPNYKRYKVDTGTNDTYQNYEWALDNTGQTINGDFGNIKGTIGADINAPEAWSINEGTNKDIIVAVLDGGVAYNHPDLITQMWDGSNCKDQNGLMIVGGCNHGYDFADNDVTPLPVDSSHGTHVSGIIAAIKNNNKGIVGIAPHVKIMAIRFGYDVASEVESIDFAIQNGAKVINASYGGGSFSQAEYDAINRFKNAGGIFVVAAGNSSLNNENTHEYPSDYNLDNIISVAATDQNDNLTSFSNYGTTSVDVGAPGENILSTIADIVNFNENFENIDLSKIPANWILGGTNNDWGVLSASNNKVLFSSMTQYPYASNANTTIDSSVIDLSSKNGATISFRATCDTDYVLSGWKDYMELEYSPDGVNFTPAVDPFYGGDFKWDEAYLDNDSNPTGSASYYFDGVSIPNKYLTSNFKFRYRWVTDNINNNYKGCFVDDISINTFSNGSDEKYAYYSGTSMATPFVSGLAGLLLGYNTSITSTQAKNAILDSGDTLSSLLSKTVTGKRINAESALKAISPVKKITAFDIINLSSLGVINETDKTIKLEVVSGTNIKALAPTITIEGSSISPLSGAIEDFTSPVSYTVTAKDGTTQVYTVSVKFIYSNKADILSFDSITPSVLGVINGTDIALLEPYGTNLTSLPIKINLSQGATVSPTEGDYTFVNGVPIVYTVTAEDGITTKNYNITVSLSNPADLTLLTEAISHAQSIYDASTEGDIPGQYLSGSKLILLDAISKAKLLTDMNFQSVIDEELLSLNTTVNSFNLKIVPLSDVTILSADILTAQSLYDISVEGINLGQYTYGSKNILLQAINKAKNISNNDTQSVVDIAVVALDDAITLFQKGKVMVSPIVVSSGGGGGGGGGYTPVLPANKVLLPVVQIVSDCKSGATIDPITKIPCSVSVKLEDKKIETKVTDTTLFTSYIFKRVLRLNMIGTDVKELQKYLNNHGFSVSIYGSGSKGKETNKFGPATKKALIKFQKAKGIKLATGSLDLTTRNLINKK